MQRRSRWGAATAGVAALPLLLLVGANAVDELTSAAYSIFVPEIRHHYHLSLTAIGLIAGVAGPVALAVNLPLGWLGDRVRRTRLAGVGTAVGAASALLVGATVSFPGFVVGAVGMILGSDGEIAHRSLLADYYPLAVRSRIFAFYDIGEYGASALAPLIAGALSLALGWRVVFVIAAVPAAFVAVRLTRLRDPLRGGTDRAGIGLSGELAQTEEPPSGWLETFRVLWGIPTARLIYPALAFASAASVGYGVAIASFWHDRYHLGPFGRGTAASVAAVAGVGGALLVATVAQRWMNEHGPRRFVLLVGGMELLSGAAMIPMVVWHSLSNSIAWNCVTIGTDAVTETGIVVIASLVIPARMRTLGFATGAAWALLGLTAGPIFGLIADSHGTGFALGLTAIPSAIEGLLVLLVIPVISADLATAASRQTVLAELRAERRRVPDSPVLCARGIVVESPSGRRVDGIDLDIAAGETVILTGGNGAGKSTLLQVLCGLVVPDQGVVAVEGRSIAGDAAAAVRAGVVYAPGATSLFEDLTVAEHLRLSAWTARGGKVVAPVSQRLQERADVRAGELSGGERQLLNLEMALAVPTSVVLLDELGFGLSDQGRADAAVLLAAVRERGTAVVAVEQKAGDILPAPYRTVTMDGGRIVATAKARFLVEQRKPVPTSVGDGGRLEAIDLCVRYGGVVALDNVSITVSPGEILAVSGPNGSGKSTLLDVLAGAQQPASGWVLLDGQDVTTTAAHGRAQLGLRRCLQGARLWPTLTVAEALALAVRPTDSDPPGLLQVVARSAAVAQDETDTQVAVDRLVAEFGLEQWRHLPIQRLSTGTRQVVALASLAAGRPRIALVDEPVAGVAAHERPAIARMIRDLARSSGAGVVLVEHDDEFVTALADRVVRLDGGAVVAPTTRKRRPERAAR
jgi:ABC-type branched-subunit amino acid transport system ATPase component